MTEISLEYAKRTCLICGCHTSQTINIYEPRSGPNIVELIQAKFKFQPLNDDKYLCSSCNNWLINWQSLKTLNIHDSDNASMIFQCHLNNVLPNNDMNPKEKFCRPIAVCRPINIIDAPSNVDGVENFQKILMKNITKTANAIINANGNLQAKKCENKNSTMKLFRRFNRVHCRCGRTISRRMKRKQCTILRRWHRKTNQLLSTLIQQQRQEKYNENKRQTFPQTKMTNKKENQSNRLNHSQNKHRACNTKDYLKEPLLDGRMIAMLRRIGTTLSQEEETTMSTMLKGTEMVYIKRLPKIMSPIKKKYNWSRPLANDEIPLNFDVNISEVLPILTTSMAKRRLNYTNLPSENGDNTNNDSYLENNVIQENLINVSLVNDSDNDDNGDDDKKQERNTENTENIVNFDLPKGLTITLV